jgi:uncharacterized membrane protein YfcA
MHRDLAFAVLSNGLSAAMAYARLKRIDYKMGITFAIANISTVVLGVLAIVTFTRTVFQAIFGSLLIIPTMITLLQIPVHAAAAECVLMIQKKY